VQVDLVEATEVGPEAARLELEPPRGGVEVGQLLQRDVALLDVGIRLPGHVGLVGRDEHAVRPRVDGGAEVDLELAQVELVVDALPRGIVVDPHGDVIGSGEEVAEDGDGWVEDVRALRGGVPARLETSDLVLEPLDLEGQVVDRVGLLLLELLDARVQVVERRRSLLLPALLGGLVRRRRRGVLGSLPGRRGRREGKRAAEEEESEGKETWLVHGGACAEVDEKADLESRHPRQRSYLERGIDGTRPATPELATPSPAVHGAPREPPPLAWPASPPHGSRE